MIIRNALFLLLLAPAFAFHHPASADDYRLQRGDTVALTVLGYPDLAKRATIDSSGHLSIPLIGRVMLLDETADSASRKIAQLLTTKDVVQGARASVEIVDYAPVYVGGNVAKPGSFAFRPGMTVRHIIAVAGGVGLKVEDTSLSDGWAQYKLASLALLRITARATRLEAERSGSDTVDFRRLTSSPADRAFLARLVELETERFASRKAETLHESTYLKKMLASTLDELKNLATQRVSEEQIIESLSEDQARLRQLFDRKVIPFTRVSEGLQALALAKARHFASAQKLAEAQRLALDLERRVQRHDEAIQDKLTVELQSALVDIEAARAQLKAAQMKIDKMRDPAASANHGIVIRIYRYGVRAGVSADESTELRSGDMVEVSSGPDERLTSDADRGRPGVPQ